MKKALKWTYNTLRATIMTVVVLLVVAYGALYLALSMPFFQNKIKAVAEKQLSDFLETDVTIGKVSISPFNQVILTDVSIPDRNGDDLIKVSKLGAGVSLYSLVVNRRPVFNYAEIDGLRASITRPDKDSPTNLQFIIDKLKPKPGKPPTPYDIQIQNAVIRNSSLSYDVLNEPQLPQGRFDANHLAINNLTADVSLPRIKNNDFVVDLKRMAFNEKNGLTVKQLGGKFKIDDTRLEYSNLTLDLPGTHLAPAGGTFHYSSLKNAVNEIKVAPINLVMEHNYITPADFKTFEPRLAQLDKCYNFSVNAESTFDKLNLKTLKVNATDGSLDLDTKAVLTNYRSPRAMTMAVQDIKLATAGRHVNALLGAFTQPPQQVSNALTQCGNIALSGSNISSSRGAAGDALKIGDLNFSAQDGNLKLALNADVDHLSSPRDITYDVRNLNLSASPQAVKTIKSLAANLPPAVNNILDKCGTITLAGNARGSLNNALAQTAVTTAMGNLDFDGEINASEPRKTVKGRLATRDLDLGEITGKKDLLGTVTMDADVDATAQSLDDLTASIKGHFDHLDFKGYRYHDITADVNVDHNRYGGNLVINDPNGKVNLTGDALLNGAATAVNFDLQAQGVNMARTHLVPGNNMNDLNVTMSGNLTGHDLNSLAGNVSVNNLSFVNNNTGKGLHVKNLEMMATKGDEPQRLIISTDFMQANVTGNFDYNTLVPAFKNIAAKCFPEFMSGKTQPTAGKNNFDFNLVVDPNEEFEDFLSTLVNLPVKLLYRATVTGHFNEVDNELTADVNMPYLQQGKNIIEGTKVHIAKESGNDNVALHAQTIFPSKKGNIALNLDANAVNDCLDTQVNWIFNRETDYHGTVNLSALMGRDSNGKFKTTVNVNPTEVVVNDTVWQVEPGALSYENGILDVKGIEGSCDEQFIKIQGRASRNPNDELTVSLNDIHLDYIFETLKINHVNFGGMATGEFKLADLFSKQPRLSTDNLHIDNMTYNGALMGDGDISSHFDSENTAVVLNCDLAQRNGLHTQIKGEIFAAADSLYMEFDANKANVEFMKPFMEAFTDEVHGLVSGHAVLFGNFKTIDLEGDIFAEDLSLKIGYTNTVYSCTDSVHIRPGMINFGDVTIYDRDRHTAKLNGWLKHDAFHNPEFNFTVTDATNFLCYDITPAMNADWYGTVYGNGNAIIAGEPGEVRIGVNMKSAERSKFTFVLSDAQEASEYNFITMRDRDKLNGNIAAEPDSLPVDTVPAIVRQLAQNIDNNSQQESAPTRYLIDLHADITPDAELVLVMDPVGGDRIRAYGSGNLRLSYNSIDDSFEMFGKYALDKGSYNFTLQDIIIKDFTIRSGSVISFDGDPYNAILDISAVYSLNANLSDLDASFSTDRDINRTNVPVNALLKVKGDITEPELSFDLEFPTLSSDAYRKVKSVISTDDMMSRQIIYLLALNRFYTPDFMQSGDTRNNELTSVASSTISSQLSSILGQLSDKWQISPNFRSDKGDFSDVEVDLALSSQLLNNRLIFNGNFGYRDNTYNTRNSNFIGDFDLEYLLNKQGTIRLKAYNHFNDQNYYVREAMTTQGVGVVFKHDFDNVKSKKPATPDSTAATPPDSLIIFKPRKNEASDSLNKQ